jgi:hypothetical protein
VGGFTLVELMVSIAIAVIIILGIEQVFSIASKTIGAGQSIGTMNRDDRALQSVLTSDFSSADTGSDCPAFMIRSGQAYAFESASDAASASTPGDPTKDPNFTATGGTIPVTFYNYRNHRIDRVAFFARNFFGRQTGGNDSGNTQFISPTTSNEAYIWYGHVAQPDNYSISQSTAGQAGGYCFDPGDNTYSVGSDKNDNNLYASDWILGRAAIILDPLTTSDNSYITAATSDGDSLGPLSVFSKAADGKPVALYNSRYDQALTSIASFNQTLSAFTGTGGPYSTWASGTSGSNWYTYLIGTPPSGSPELSGRFQASPYPIKVKSGTGPGGTSGLINSSLAHTFPIFVRGCTQFIVEYTGNFYTKDVNGNAVLTTNQNGSVSSPPDPTGALDFQMVNGVKQVRWYGFPRHTSGASSTSISPTTDVVPLGVFLKASGVTTLPMFERFYAPTGSSITWPPASPTLTGDLSGAVPSGAEYVAAWGPDTSADVNSPLPKMIRITLAMDDPNGNVATPQWFEYVINLNP